jgi:hypothetical protein
LRPSTRSASRSMDSICMIPPSAQDTSRVPSLL